MKETYPVYKKMFSELSSRISGMEAGRKLQSEAELCREFAVSRMTVNKVINMLAAEGTVYRIKGSGTYIGKTPSSRKIIYFLLPSPDFFIYDCTYNAQLLLCGLTREAALSGIEVRGLPVSQVNNPENIDWKALERLSENDWVVVCGFWYKKVLPLLGKRKCRVIFCDFYSEEKQKYPPLFRKWALVRIDARAAISNAVKHLAKLGRKRIGYLFDVYHQDAPPNTGYRDGLAEAGLPFRSEHCIYAGNTDEMFDRLADKRKSFDALIISNPSLVRPAMKLLSETGKKIPDDLAVLVFNDHKKLLDSTPPLAAIAMPYMRTGREIIKSIYSSEKPEGEYLFSAEIIDRESVLKGSGTGRDSECVPDSVFNKNFTF